MERSERTFDTFFEDLPEIESGLPDFDIKKEEKVM